MIFFANAGLVKTGLLCRKFLLYIQEKPEFLSQVCFFTVFYGLGEIRLTLRRKYIQTQYSKQIKKININNMNRIKKMLLVIAIVVIVSEPILAQDVSPAKPKAKIKPFMTLIIEPLLSGTANAVSPEFSKIPDIMKAVPKHPDDVNIPASNVAPIEVSTLTDAHLWWTPMYMNINVGIGTERLTVEGGPFGQLNVGSQETTERNYTNAVGSSQKGYGAALTYIKLNSTRWIYGFTGMLRYKPNPKDGLYLTLNYSQYWQNMSIRTGWDRNDKYTEYTKYPIGTFLFQEVSLGIEMNFDKTYVKMSIGDGKVSLSSLDWGKSMTVSVPDAYFFVKLCVGIRLDAVKDIFTGN